MAAPNRRFSFMRLIANAVPNFARDDPTDVDLSPPQADALVASQLPLPSPLYLSPTAFSTAQITDSASLSRKIHRALLKASIIAEAPPAGGLGGAQESEPVTTAAITSNFAHQLAVISVHAQRKLVGLLFFWEEECVRFRLLDVEEAEIRRAMEERASAASAASGMGEGQVGVEGEAGDGQHQMADLEVALQAVRMRRVLLPSQRAEGTVNVGTGLGRGELPAYM